MPKGLFQTVEERMKVEGYSRRTIETYLRELRKFADIRRPRSEHKLPRILSRDEILQIVRTIQNLRYRLMIELLCAAGLRVSEVVNLRVQDMNLDELMLFVRRDTSPAAANAVIPPLPPTLCRPPALSKDHAA